MRKMKFYKKNYKFENQHITNKLNILKSFSNYLNIIFFNFVSYRGEQISHRPPVF